MHRLIPCHLANYWLQTQPCKGKTRMEKNKEHRIIQSVVVRSEDYMAAVKESLELSRKGIIRMVLLPTQAHHCAGLDSARTLEEILSTTARQLSTPSLCPVG